LWTSPTPISSDQATWNQPVGFIDNGGLAMSARPSWRSGADDFGC
jgi:hypothetical protein